MIVYSVTSTHGLDDCQGGTVYVATMEEARKIRDELRPSYDSEAQWRRHVEIEKVTIDYKGVATVIACLNRERYAAASTTVWPVKRGPSQAQMDRWSAENEAMLQEERKAGGSSGDEQ